MGSKQTGKQSALETLPIEGTLKGQEHEGQVDQIVQGILVRPGRSPEHTGGRMGGVHSIADVLGNPVERTTGITPHRGP